MPYLCFLTLFCFMLAPPSGRCSEAYFIENEPVLLYKLIDGWNNCRMNRAYIETMTPDRHETARAFNRRKAEALAQFSHCDQLVGRRIRCEVRGCVRCDYEEKAGRLSLAFADDIGSLMDMNQRGSGGGNVPLRFRCVGSGESRAEPNQPSLTGHAAIFRNTLRLDGLRLAYVRRIQRAMPHIAMVIKGMVSGLENDRIRLLTSETEGQPDDKGAMQPPVTLTLFSPATGMELIRYESVDD